jgi:hypothetical protein
MIANTDIKLKAQCGMPTIKAQRQDSPFLFLDHLHTNAVPVTERISMLFIWHCVYIAFLGKPSSDGLNKFNESDSPPYSVCTSPLFWGNEEAMQVDQEQQLEPQQADDMAQAAQETKERVTENVDQAPSLGDISSDKYFEEMLWKNAKQEREREQRRSEKQAAVERAEQERLQREAEERAAAEAEQAAVERAEQERLQREAEERAAVETE